MSSEYTDPGPPIASRDERMKMRSAPIVWTESDLKEEERWKKRLEKTEAIKPKTVTTRPSAPLMKVDFCLICHGISQKVKCLFCKMSITDYRKISEAQVNHNLYLRKTWLKLQRFDMLTTGDFLLDEDLQAKWGLWRGMGPVESYARRVMRGESYPLIFTGTPFGRDIDDCVRQLSTIRHLIQDTPPIPEDELPNH